MGQFIESVDVNIDESLLKIIRSSGLFDIEWIYLTAPLVRGDVDELIKQYLRGEEPKFSANSLFDEEWYSKHNSDVADAGIHPLVHYILFGAKERRAPSPLFNPEWYEETYPESSQADEGTFSFHLTAGRVLGNSPNRLFDVAWYLLQNPDVAASGIDPVDHYVAFGAAEGRNPHAEFETRWYTSRHPDLLRLGANPLAHFLEFGAPRQERTRYKPLSGGSVNADLPPGWAKLKYYNVVKPRLGESFKLNDPRPRILFVTHDMSRTGAPLIILTLIKFFAQLNQYSLITFTDQPGDLERDFRRYSHVFDSSRHSINDKELNLSDLVSELGLGGPVILALCNTANTNHYSGPFHALGIPVISLVHEMLYLYPENYIRDLYEFSDQIIFPAQFVRDVADAKVPLPPGLSKVLPQGLLDARFGDGSREEARLSVRRELGVSADALLVLGCGTVNIRKGVDIFISVAQRIFQTLGDRAHFVWLGSDTMDKNFAYWMKKDVDSSNIRDVFHFAGLKDDPAPYYQAADVFAMTSREDPFPCVIHEAMACSLATVAFADAGGAPEALAEDSGIVVPYGDVSAMAAEIEKLLTRSDERARIGANALRRVETRYRFEDYFLSVASLARETLGAPLIETKSRAKVPVKPRVFFFGRDWWISGVNSFTETLMHDLIDRGVDCELVFPSFNDSNRKFLPQLPMRFLNLIGPQEDEWQRLIDFANENAPCILVPNYDYLTSAITPALSSRIGVVGIVHSDDIEHYDHVYRLARYWNKIVCSNRHLLDKVVDINPSLADRTLVIPYGVSVKGGVARIANRAADHPIRIVFCGRLMQHQKRVRDLVAITRSLDREAVPYRLTVIGEGDEREWLATSWNEKIKNGVVSMVGRLTREEMYEVFRESDVFLLVSSFEGMPISLIEAMACGCAPVVSDLPSGIPDLVSMDVGDRLPIGDVHAFAQSIAALQRNPARLASMSAAAIKRVSEGGFRTGDMGEHYLAVFEEIWSDLLSGRYVRPQSLVWRGPLSSVSPPSYLFKGL
ncbi:glycosyltransferase family 4 protein [Methylocella tundrae]|uniref:Glycosyl transferase family 1 domain-containing protein n=1 Tax=Methylocella tundrae TaxID=227605 RepID=A0A4U8YZZ1_METTU|nr:glycosyltransferase family 4 protein [Methylocella tundrae]WPP05434.1 glycosyltransferase family 4 protein [Methylocella tundrae]VFU07847.1 protein of unknown function [Methylocella tundrae]